LAGKRRGLTVYSVQVTLADGLLCCQLLRGVDGINMLYKLILLTYLLSNVDVLDARASDSHSQMYIYILLNTVLATDVNKYSLASARCQPIWRTKFGELDLFLAVAKDYGMSSSLNQSQQSISPCFG